MEQNFWEQGNSVKVNFGKHLNLLLRNWEALKWDTCLALLINNYFNCFVFLYETKGRILQVIKQ